MQISTQEAIKIASDYAIEKGENLEKYELIVDFEVTFLLKEKNVLGGGFKIMVGNEGVAKDIVYLQ